MYSDSFQLCHAILSQKESPRWRWKLHSSIWCVDRRCKVRHYYLKIVPRHYIDSPNNLRSCAPLLPRNSFGIPTWKHLFPEFSNITVFWLQQSTDIKIWQTPRYNKWVPRWSLLHESVSFDRLEHCTRTQIQLQLVSYHSDVNFNWNQYGQCISLHI